MNDTVSRLLQYFFILFQNIFCNLFFSMSDLRPTYQKIILRNKFSESLKRFYITLETISGRACFRRMLKRNLEGYQISSTFRGGLHFQQRVLTFFAKIVNTKMLDRVLNRSVWLGLNPPGIYKTKLKQVYFDDVILTFYSKHTIWLFRMKVYFSNRFIRFLFIISNTVNILLY